MFEGLFQLVHKTEDKETKLLITPGTPIPHLKDALVQFLAYVVQFEKDQLATQEKAHKESVTEQLSPQD